MTTGSLLVARTTADAGKIGGSAGAGSLRGAAAWSEP
jgi:hypothetical protein